MNSLKKMINKIQEVLILKMIINHKYMLALMVIMRVEEIAHTSAGEIGGTLELQQK